MRSQSIPRPPHVHQSIGSDTSDLDNLCHWTSAPPPLEPGFPQLSSPPAPASAMSPSCSDDPEPCASCTPRAAAVTEPLPQSSYSPGIPPRNSPRTAQKPRKTSEDGPGDMRRVKDVGRQDAYLNCNFRAALSPWE